MQSRNKISKKPARGRRYTLYFQRDADAGGYTAHIPALGIVTEGQTLREARAMARDAVAGRLEVLRGLGLPLPKDVRPEQMEVSL